MSPNELLIAIPSTQVYNNLNLIYGKYIMSILFPRNIAHMDRHGKPTIHILMTSVLCLQAPFAQKQITP